MISVTAPGAALFDNYTKLPPRVPAAVWMALRVACLAAALAEIVLLFAQPALGLRLFWQIAVPLLPALFAVAPGLWRQVCPMAFVNQMPKLLGFGGRRTLPLALRYWSYIIGIATLLVMVSLRHPVLNRTGWATGALCAASLVLALLGALLFKGRSGWCGTFCPLAPVQRTHGQAPLIVVRNGYCPTCVGCQKNCYDFNPRAAIFGDLGDTDPRHATQRVLFVAMLPGLIIGYYTTAPLLAQGLAVYLLGMAGCVLVSTGLFLVTRALFRASTYRMVTVFGAVALLAYYFYAGPVLMQGLAGLLDATAPATLVNASRLIALPIVLGLWRASVVAERAYEQLDSGGVAVRIDDSRLRKAGGSGASGAQITERRTGKCFPAEGKTVLEAMEAAGVPIDFGCRSGLCGADPVGIVEGHAQLDAPGDDELATLRRLGLAGRARLACCARACGPVTIDLDPRSAPEAAAAEPPAPRADLALAAAVARVVIIGNGIAGITVAEALRRDSESLEITLVADEPHHFYNRMALGRVIYNRSSMDGMFLVPDGWYRDNRIQVWLNTEAQAIDRAARRVRLGTGQQLPYDRLVLATGAQAAPPGPGFVGAGNAFLLRTAADAQGIRACVQRLGVRDAVVIGGGVLGVEAAEALNHLDLRVTLLHRGARLMDRQLDAEAARRLAAYLADAGIATLTGARVAGFDRAGAADDALLRAVRLEDGHEIEAALFVACAGIQPNTALARTAGLALRRGIRVDVHMQTQDPAILAVGDAAEPEQPGPAGLWPVAVEHARMAAATILGQADKAAPLAAPRVVLALKSDGVDLRSFGDPETVPDGAVLRCAEPDALAWWRMVLRDGVVLGAVYFGPPGSAQAFTRLLQQGADAEACLAALAPAP